MGFLGRAISDGRAGVSGTLAGTWKAMVYFDFVFKSLVLPGGQ